MTKTLVFWAQALDNLSADHMNISGAGLPPDDVRRQEVVSMVSNVIKVGTRIFKDQGVQLTDDEHGFVVEVPSEDRDRGGRGAPIICYVAYQGVVDDALGPAVVTGLSDFAHRIGRTILPVHLDLASQSVVALKKKSSTRKAALAIGKVVVALVLLGLVFWLA